MAIYLVRHGETSGNRDRVLQTPFTELTEMGHQQARELAQGLSETSITKIVCSDYTRTQQTAAPLHSAQQCELVLEPLLQERSFGDIRGKSYDEVEEDFFHIDYAPPNGETFGQFTQRVAQAWQCVIDMAANTQGNLLVMTHGLVLRELVSTHLHIKPNIQAHSDFHNTCVTVVDSGDLKSVGKLCDISHLSDKIRLGGAV